MTPSVGSGVNLSHEKQYLLTFQQLCDQALTLSVGGWYKFVP